MTDQMTLPVSEVVVLSRPSKRQSAPWYADRWLLATVVTASLVSIIATWAAYASQTIVLYSDAHSHLAVARRVVDNVTPGLAQFGAVWLPLPHIIMLPFIWNDFLWRTGLAGSLASMPCYVAATVAIFLTIRRLTMHSAASFIGALVFVLNPNILYLQSTPLSEPVLFATLALASYFFILWAQAGKTRHLLLAALWTMLATIARYDGWPLFLAFLGLIVIIGWQQKQGRGKIITDLMLFGVLGGLGIALWFLWNLVVFSDPLYFSHGPFSSQKQTASFIQTGLADTYHSLGQSLVSYGAAATEAIGPVIFALGGVGVIAFLVRHRLSPTALATLTLLVPFVFYITAFYTGQDVMFVPHADHPPFFFYNARFGAEMAAPAAVFIGTLTAQLSGWWSPSRMLLTGAILAQQIIIARGGVIALQDGQYGTSCYTGRPIAAYLAQHYNGGKMLIDSFDNEIDVSVANMSFKDLIYEGDNTLWNAALADPAKYADWVATKQGDLVTAKLDIQSVAFLTTYEPVIHESDNATLWHRKGLPPLPNRPLPNDVLQPYQLCDEAKQIYAN